MTITGNILGTARKLVFTPVKRLLNAMDVPVIVLLYHRVTKLASDPEMLAVTPDNFRAHMQHLKKNFPLVRFEEDWKALSKPAVCVTFDDGYADNALEALPILEEVGVPATFFVSTGNIDTQQWYWWDELQKILLEQQNVPATFTLSGPVDKTWPTGTIDQKRQLYRELVALMTNADLTLRNSIISELRSWGAFSGRADEAHRPLSLQELRRLAGSRQVTIGAHTVSHCQLSSLSKDRQRQEIMNSKRQLENRLGEKISVFSYPYGRRCQYTKETVVICREAGFAKTASNFPGQAHRWSDPQQIPRHLVRDWPMQEFAARLEGFWTR